MRILAHAHIRASEDVRFSDRPDLCTTILRSGEGDETLHITGPVDQRAAFLRELAAKANAAADALVVEVPLPLEVTA